MDEKIESIIEECINKGIILCGSPVEPKPLLIADLADSYMDFAEMDLKRGDFKEVEKNMRTAYNFIGGKPYYKWSWGHLLTLKKVKDRYNSLAKEYIPRGLEIDLIID